VIPNPRQGTSSRIPLDWSTHHALTTLPYVEQRSLAMGGIIPGRVA
jgi:hypothetical protein